MAAAVAGLAAWLAGGVAVAQGAPTPSGGTPEGQVLDSLRRGWSKDAVPGEIRRDIVWHVRGRVLGVSVTVTLQELEAAEKRAGECSFRDDDWTLWCGYERKLRRAMDYFQRERWDEAFREIARNYRVPVDEAAMGFVQSLSYGCDGEAGPLEPVQVLAFGRACCRDAAVFATGLLRALGIDALIWMAPRARHAAVAVATDPPRGMTTTYEGRTYTYWDAVSGFSAPGDAPADVAESRIFLLGPSATLAAEASETSTVAEEPTPTTASVDFPAPVAEQPNPGASQACPPPSDVLPEAAPGGDPGTGKLEATYRDPDVRAVSAWTKLRLLAKDERVRDFFLNFVLLPALGLFILVALVWCLWPLVRHGNRG